MSAQRCGVGRVTVTSSVPDDSYIVRVTGRSTETGSTFDTSLERVNGAIASIPSNIKLQTMYRDLPVTSMTDEDNNVITYTHNEISLPVNLLSTSDQPADLCALVEGSDDLEYTNNTLSFNNLTFPNIAMVRRLDREQSAVFMGSLLGGGSDTGPLYVCVSPRRMSAFYTMDFIDDIRMPYQDGVSNLRPPQIASSSTPPTDVVSTSGETFQVGTSPISVLEELHMFALQCRLSSAGSPPVSTYSWSRNGVPLVSDNVNYLISGDRLIIRTTNDPQDEGMYTCTVNNGAGMDSASTVVTITQETPVTTPAPTQPPTPMPMWFTHPFNSVSICNDNIMIVFCVKYYYSETCL